MGLKAQKNPRSNYQIGSRIVKNFPNFFRVLGTLTEIITKKMVNFSKKIPGHFQVFQDAWAPCDTVQRFLGMMKILDLKHKTQDKGLLTSV